MEYLVRPWFKQWWGVIIIIFLAIILFFLAVSAFYFVGEIKNSSLKINRAKQPISGQKYGAASSDSYWLGSANAKITIVEFGDFACPVCEKAFPTTGQIRQNYKNDVKFIWRDFPVVTEYSSFLALAGRCAGEQGLFWPMHDKLFQNQNAIYSLADQFSADTTSTQFTNQLTNLLVSLANQSGADTVKFKDCLDKQKYLPQIQKDLTDGQAFGIIGSESGTPTYFINGYKIAGDVPYDMFVKIIEEMKK
jgi:protein-disulfide isomerase